MDGYIWSRLAFVHYFRFCFLKICSINNEYIWRDIKVIITYIKLASRVVPAPDENLISVSTN